MEEEIWKVINDFPNYEVSSLGQVRNIVTGLILKPEFNSSGYYRCTLCNNLKKQTITIHKLVALCFIPNLNNKPTVNHKDRNKINNNVNNLEWATYSEQNKHKSKSCKIPCHSLKILRICKDTDCILDSYNSLMLASIWVFSNNLSNSIKINTIKSKISLIINGNNSRTAYGYKWKIDNGKINNDEVWKQIPPHLTKNEKHYYVSNYGNIKIKNRIKRNFTIMNKYYVVSIMKTHYYVHRLVALVFLDNLNNKKVVNHIDGNKLNNNVENLEWST
jgi:hypothetical protein